ncbi:sensor histidine kinase [Metabacillus sediminilitoris]|uniref:histidine kinase n=1 Tax=Metabacillus sediminilitoris TaxID=2567941 RepID=A0A4S4C1W3_9BACI|nr:sensor histidine kinase [Metabacillus sediminilitoris]QGQ47797.1 GHKL domain-containing protein [Metabacillus sediminilitoris]THF81090.1 sensor histidine kinase [Metabacillus sediminilitoris]
MRRLSIQTKITGLIFFIVGFSLLLAGIVIISNFIDAQEEDLKQRALLTARTVAEVPDISFMITGDAEERSMINERVESMRVIHQADYIVVMDMDHIRLSHPIPTMIGQKSRGTDEGPAFAELTFTTKAKGEAGSVIRGFVPILNQDHQQVGVVLAGYIVPTFLEVIWNLRMEIFLTSAISLLFGGWGAWLLASRIKKEMFNLEPHEIAGLVVERTETFNAMREGIIAIDFNENITVFNNKAKEMMGITGEVIGKNINTIITDTRLPEILRLQKPIYNKELTVRNLNILSNRIPIKVKGVPVGAVAIFQDRTEVKKLAEELTGVKAFVSALRVQNHEHMNKLHTIAGLLQLGHKNRALEYVFQITEENEELTRFLSKNIISESLSGLLLSKVRRGKELGITVHIDRHSRLESFPSPLDDHDFVIIFGNLIENAFDSFKDSTLLEKEIYISIEQHEELLSILIEDNGIGISKKAKPFIFQEGFSTKEGSNRGIGLFLIKEIVEKANGTIQIESSPEQGTSFTITFSM